MSDLQKLMAVDDAVRSIVANSRIPHREVARMINELGHATSERSVRRARRGSEAKVAVVVGDYQIGCHDRRFIERQAEAIRDLRPDVIVSTGDELDVTALGRWVRGLPGEFENSLQDELDEWFEIASMINEAAPDAVKRMCRSNHTERVPNSLASRLPGARDLRCLSLPNLLRLDELGWTYDDPSGSATEFLPGITYSHGDEWSFTSKTQASKSAEVIKERRTHVVFGHTHQAGVYTQALGWNFNRETRWAMNVGTGMAFDRADYIKNGSPNWSRGLGIIYHDGTDSHPELVLDLNGKMRVNGKVY